MKYAISCLIRGTARFHSPALLAQLGWVSAFVLILFTVSASAAPLVYVVTASQQFGTVDLQSGHFQEIGNPTPDGMSNLVWLKGSLLSLTTSGADVGSLARINPRTGKVTDIGPTGLGFNAFNLAEVGGKLYLRFQQQSLLRRCGDRRRNTNLGYRDPARPEHPPHL